MQLISTIAVQAEYPTPSRITTERTRSSVKTERTRCGASYGLERTIRARAASHERT